MSNRGAEATTAHPDVMVEQAVIDHAYDCLRAMRDRAIHLKSLGYQGGNIHADVGLTPEAAAADDARKQRRVDDLAEPATALCFGRIDRADDETFYIGRRHVEDGNGELVVTDWRAPVAVSFYRATVADRLGLQRRRRFVVEGRDLVDIFEENLEHPSGASTSSFVPDPLLAEVERTRTGTMRDIVSTIQGEQDAIIRAPLDECVVVQGGPGTGKTAVGLHRVAFLLYTHREQFERERVLIVGPNRIFFRYISQVLPSLGETAAVQLTIEGLTGGGYWIRGEDTPEQAAVKGDARMADVVRNALVDRIDHSPDDVTFATSFGSVTLRSVDLVGVIERSLAGGAPLNNARSSVRDQLVDLAWRSYADRHAAEPSGWARFVESVRASAEFKKVLDKLWPTFSAPEVVRRLYGNKRVLERAGEGILTDAERALLFRKPSSRMNMEQWTSADLAILDEVESLLSRKAQQYGHIIVDEAQDLSDMQLRIIARRARRGSMTILGDLAQATAPGAQTSWSDVSRLLAAPAVRYEELTVGYRVPAPILELANRLLAQAAPGLRPTTSARTHGPSPSLITSDHNGIASAAASAVSALAERWVSVGVVAPEFLHGSVADALTANGVVFTDGRKTSELGEHVTLLPPAMTKGLEFDAVVVVEPSALATGSPSGVRLLYVALTRAVQELTIVHAAPLPQNLESVQVA
jgi:DNA helicase IV